MKKISIAILTLLVAFSANLSAQGKYGKDSAECIKYLSYYQEYYKQKAYDDALPNWRKAYKVCPPTASQNMLLNGTTLLRRVISQNAGNEAYRNALIDSLLQLHRDRAVTYPKNAVSAFNNMGQDLANYIKDDPDRLYKAFDEIIENNKANTITLDVNHKLFLNDVPTTLDELENTLKEKVALKPSLVTLAHCCADLAPPKSIRPWAMTCEPNNIPIKRNIEEMILTLFIGKKLVVIDNLIVVGCRRQSKRQK